jgi:TolB protein
MLSRNKLAIWLIIPLIISIIVGCTTDKKPTLTTSLVSDTASPTITNLPTLELTQTPYVVTATPVTVAGPQNVFIFSMMDNGYAHLFAYSPQGFPLTRLTTDPWDDITPALSPDGTQVAFSSRRNGYWDLYLLNLTTGNLIRLTDTMEYEASPSWSPDGLWLVFETYRNGNLDLDILSLANPNNRYQLTNELSSDHSPAWSPLGRQIAYISAQTGENEVWLADLDKIGDDRFSNISRNDQGIETHPTWSPDGKTIAWVSAPLDSSLSGIYIWNNLSTATSSTWLGSGDWPIWSPDGSQLLSLLLTPNNSYIEGLNLSGEYTLPPIALPDSIRGFDFGYAAFTSPLATSIQDAANQIPTPSFVVLTTPSSDVPGERLNLVELIDVQAPYPRMLDLLDEAFSALRQRVILETGWDALASLDNAYVPISVPLNPGFSEDWLYTGRAFSINPILIEAGWITIVKEEIGQQTFWRIFMRTRAQDGSQGEPMHQVPWDIYARFSGTAMAYDQGGQSVASIPPGFWMDFTALAKAYGWERLPSLSNWQSFFNGTLFNEFVNTSGLNWQTAMLQIYPPEIFETPTSIILPTRTPTKTPWGYRTPSPTPTLTPRPTFTPRP